LEVGYEKSAKSTYKRQIINDQLSIWGIGAAAFHQFYQLDEFNMSKVKSYSSSANTNLYKEFFYITTSTHSVERSVYNILNVSAYIGGIFSTLAALSTIFFRKYSFTNFKIRAIQELYAIKNEEKDLAVGDDKKLSINFFDNIRIMLKLCPNKKFKRMVNKGTVKLKRDADIVTLIKDLRDVKVQLK
jgi:hypothetical protein